MVVLHQSAYVVIEHDVAARLVRLVRTAQPFGDAASARRELARWEASTAQLDRRELAVLVDFRATPMTSDPDILAVVVAQTDALALTFGRQAILISAPLLGVQAERVARAGAVLPIFTNEAAARAHLGA